MLIRGHVLNTHSPQPDSKLCHRGVSPCPNSTASQQNSGLTGSLSRPHFTPQPHYSSPTSPAWKRPYLYHHAHMEGNRTGSQLVPGNMIQVRSRWIRRRDIKSFFRPLLSEHLSRIIYPQHCQKTIRLKKNKTSQKFFYVFPHTLGMAEDYRR